MMPDLLTHTLLLFGLLGLSMSLIWVWRQHHAATRHGTMRATQRAPGHTPFPGLTRKPSCATCEDGAQEQVKVSPTAPSPMVIRRGCPRVACRTYFLETHGTPFHGTRVAPERVVWALGALAEGLVIRVVARVFAVDRNTVLQWLVHSADPKPAQALGLSVPPSLLFQADEVIR